MNDPIAATARHDAELIQAFLRARAGGERAGPFALLFDPDSDSPYMNYAIPADDAQPDAGDIAALIAVFRARGLRPRLEYAPVAAPAVEPALIAAGFEVELRPPLMTRRARPALPKCDPGGIKLERLQDAARFAELADALGEAFGSADIGADWLGQTLAGGGGIVAAIDAAGGAIIGGGMFQSPAAGVTEVAGIGVRPAWRRRGIAQAITAMLAEEAFGQGCDMAFLSAAGGSEAQIYARAGFVEQAPMLFLVLPD